MNLPEKLIFDSSAPWLPPQSPSGRFVVTPDQLWTQLSEGTCNPEYTAAATPIEVLPYIEAWRHRVIMSEEARQAGSLDYVGFHLTNSLAKVALHPQRDGQFSLKTVYRAEEARFPRHGFGRDPEQLSVLYNSLRFLVSIQNIPRAS